MKRSLAELTALCSGLIGVTAIACATFGLGSISIVKPTQPDQVDPGVSPAGARGPYRLGSSAAQVVTGCTDGTGATVPLAACLGAAAYSGYFKFTADRVVVKR